MGQYTKRPTNKSARFEQLSHNNQELSQALNLILPYEIECRLRQIPEYKDIYNPVSKKITITEKISDGGYWHVVNCLKIVAQVERMGLMGKYSLSKETLINAVAIHDIGKIQPNLQIGDSVTPQDVFEDSKLHAFRSVELSRTYDYGQDVLSLIKYHHHTENELPRDFPGRLITAWKIFRLVDGLSAAATRRNATFSFELVRAGIKVYENNERLEYNGTRVVELA